MKKDKSKNLPPKPEDEDTADFLDYDPQEDIYSKNKRVANVNPDDFSPVSKNESDDAMNEKNFEEDMSGADLDIPGAELDDSEEEIGEEDEENNYYSLGGDNHEDLEES